MGAIRTGQGEWPYRADRLCETYIGPISTPEVAARPYPLRRPEDLRHATLLHSRGRPTDWIRWSRAAGLLDLDLESGHHSESSSMAYEAAHRGMGVAIGQRFLVEDDLKAGTLISLFDHPVRCDDTYYFLSSPRYAGAPVLELFREWLIEEARRSQPRG